MIKESVNYTILDFRIKTRTVSSYSMTSHHFHDAYEIYYMNAGSRDYFISDKTVRVKQGDLVLIKPHDLHKTMDTGVSHSRILLSFKPSFLPFRDIQPAIDLCFSTSRVLTFSYSMQARLEEMLRHMILEASNQDSGYETKLQIQLADFLIELSRYLANEEANDESEPSANQKVYEVIQYLKANYAKQITLEELADDFYISRYYLTRVFKKTTGFTIFEFIHSLRIVEAQRLLRETNLKVIDIAEKVGFTNVSNFGKVFKSVTGVSPLSYRKNP